MPRPAGAPAPHKGAARLPAPAEADPTVPVRPAPGWSGLAALARAQAVPGRMELTRSSYQQLRGNTLGDPWARPLLVYLPPGYDERPAARWPVLYLLHGAFDEASVWLRREQGEPSSVERIAAVMEEQQAEAIIVMPDAWTSLGGSQYLDSPAVGRYHSYLCEGVVQETDRRYRTVRHRSHRGVAGHSSGGFGAFTAASQRPDLFGALGCAAADAMFEGVHLSTYPGALRVLQRHHDSSWRRFWQYRESLADWPTGQDMPCLDQYMLACAYGATPRADPGLFDPATGKLRCGVWEQWLAHDPVRVAGRRADALRSLRSITIAAGQDDEMHGDLGSRSLWHALGVAGAHAELAVRRGGHGSSDALISAVGGTLRAIRLGGEP